MSDPNESPGTIHGISLAQLAPYQEAAITWPRYPDGRFVRCGKCDQAIYATADIMGEQYRYEDHETQALIVAHIRQNHVEYVDGND